MIRCDTFDGHHHKTQTFILAAIGGENMVLHYDKITDDNEDEDEDEDKDDDDD